MRLLLRVKLTASDPHPPTRAPSDAPRTYHVGRLDWPACLHRRDATTMEVSHRYRMGSSGRRWRQVRVETFPFLATHARVVQAERLAPPMNFSTRSRARIPVAAAAIMALMAIMLAGCTSTTPQANQSIIPAESSSPTATTTATIAPPPGEPWPYETPTLPPDTQRNDEAGACATAEYFMKRIQYESVFGRTDTLREYSTTDCAHCKDLIAGIERRHKAGGWRRGQAILSVELFRSGPDDITDGTLCGFNVSMDASKSWDGISQTVSAEPQGSDLAVFVMKRSENSWKVYDWMYEIDAQGGTNQ